LLFSISLSACAVMQDRPTEERMDHWFSKPRYVPEFDSEKTPSELIDGLKESKCQGGTTVMSGVAPAGPNIYVPVGAQVRFHADYDTGADGVSNLKPAKLVWVWARVIVSHVDAGQAFDWTDVEVASRWLELFPGALRDVRTASRKKGRSCR